LPPPWSPWCRAFAQASHRIFLRILGIVLLRIHPRIGAIDPQFCQIRTAASTGGHSFSWSA